MNFKNNLSIFLMTLTVVVLYSLFIIHNSYSFTGPTAAPPSSSAGQILFSSAGKLGIGTSTPAEALHVIGNIKISGSLIGTLSGSLSAANVTGPAAFGINVGTYNYAFPGALAIGTTTTTGLPSSGLFVVGDLGIGNISPSYKLDVSGTFRATATSTFSGNVGIGTTGPVAKLEVSSADSSKFLQLDYSAGPTSYNLNVTNTVTAGQVAWNFTQRNNDINYDVLTFKTGNVGIGTTGPQHKLSVAGSFYSIRYAAATAIDWNNGNTQSMVLANGANTLTFSNGQDGGRYTLVLKQPASGAVGTVTWPSCPTVVRWAGGCANAPQLTAINGKTDYVGFIYQCLEAGCVYDGIAFNADF